MALKVNQLKPLGLEASFKRRSVDHPVNPVLQAVRAIHLIQLPLSGALS